MHVGRGGGEGLAEDHALIPVTKFVLNHGCVVLDAVRRYLPAVLLKHHDGVSSRVIVGGVAVVGLYASGRVMIIGISTDAAALGNCALAVSTTNCWCSLFNVACFILVSKKV